VKKAFLTQELFVVMCLMAVAMAFPAEQQQQAESAPLEVADLTNGEADLEGSESRYYGGRGWGGYGGGYGGYGRGWSGNYGGEFN